MNKSHLKRVALLIWLILILILLAFVFKSHKGGVASRNPVLIHEAGHLYEISGEIYFRRCSVDGLDHFDPTEIDTNTFQIINDVYAKDKNNVWNLGETQRCGYPIRLVLNPPADLATFSTFATSSFVAKDKISMIYNDHRLISPSKSTIYLGFGFYKDADQILKHVGYGDILPLKSVMADSRPISSNYLVDNKNVSDASNVYRKGDDAFIVMGADPESFKEMANGYALDKNNVYFKSKIVPSADPVNFEKVSDQAERDEYCGFSYWKDTHGVYLKGSLIQSADPNTFKVIQYQGRHCNIGQYSVDKDHVFYDDTLLSEVDVSTFIYKGGMTISDSENIYFAGSKCVSADTFIEDKKIGYRLKIPKGWNYTSEPQFGHDKIFDCVSGNGLYIAKGLVTKYQDDKELSITNQFIPNAIITGWKFEGEGGGGYKYQIVFPQKNTSFVINSLVSIDNLSPLSSLVSL
ncbi:MAG: DKNYY domain-containing protein [Candidatus Paceibacterota bacterium]|jgi:hypothetical protein